MNDRVNAQTSFGSFAQRPLTSVSTSESNSRTLITTTSNSATPNMPATSARTVDKGHTLVVRSRHFEYRFALPYEYARKTLSRYRNDVRAMAELEELLRMQLPGGLQGEEGDLMGGWRMEMGKVLDKVAAMRSELEAMKVTMKSRVMKSSMRLTQKPRVRR
ncbi:MAG: hypothetical protein Q9184_008458 [Pyrenodesmia sp. 2 TL-2023]